MSGFPGGFCVWGRGVRVIEGGGVAVRAARAVLEGSVGIYTSPHGNCICLLHLMLCGGIYANSCMQISSLL